jgi:hypothetical protein
VTSPSTWIGRELRAFMARPRCDFGCPRESSLSRVLSPNDLRVRRVARRCLRQITKVEATLFFRLSHDMITSLIIRECGVIDRALGPVSCLELPSATVVRFLVRPCLQAIRGPHL